MKILVTGAAGFIGMTTSLRLLSRGDEVVGLDNLNDYYEVSLKENRLARLTGHANFRFVKLDVADLAGMDARKAQEWLGREFEAAGCVPTNPVGKLLLADKILCLAKTQKDAVYAEPTPWVNSFVRAAAAAIGRAVLTIDLGNHSLGY